MVVDFKQKEFVIGFLLGAGSSTVVLELVLVRSKYCGMGTLTGNAL